MKVTNRFQTLPTLAVLPITALALATSSLSAAVVTDFSNFSESGNLLTGTNSRQQTFTPSVSPAGSVTVTWAGSGTGVGQETYLSDEFATLAAGYRMTVDLTSATFLNSSDTIGLAVASTETPTTRMNLFFWGWRTGSMSVGTFDGTEGYTGAIPAFPATGSPDSVFIERTATGWTLGSIKGATETISYNNVTAIGSTSITADGSAIGLFSDMRTNTSTWTVGNLTIIPEPSGTLLGALGGLALLLRRRRSFSAAMSYDGYKH